MKKTILQMFSTVLILWFLFAVQFPVTLQGILTMTQTASEGIPVPILMYHSILKDSAQAGKYVLSPEVLQQDLQYLQKNGYTAITVSDLIAYVQNAAPLPEKPVMITFDDGYFNNYLYVMPLLEEFHMKAVISIIGSQTALFTENGQENAYWSHVSTEHLRQMAASGVFEIQNHSWDLHTYGQRHGCVRIRGEDTQAYAQMLQNDTERVQTLLTEAGLPTPQCYTYPFGSFSEESEQLLQRMGFQCTLGCEEGMNYITQDPNCLFLLKRWNRPSGISTERFMQKMGV